MVTVASKVTFAVRLIVTKQGTLTAWAQAGNSHSSQNGDSVKMANLMLTLNKLCGSLLSCSS